MGCIDLIQIMSFFKPWNLLRLCHSQNKTTTPTIITTIIITSWLGGRGSCDQHQHHHGYHHEHQHYHDHLYHNWPSAQKPIDCRLRFIILKGLFNGPKFWSWSTNPPVAQQAVLVPRPRTSPPSSTNFIDLGFGVTSACLVFRMQFF